MRVRIDKTIYQVIEQCGEEVCIVQTFDYADGIKRQLRIWTNCYDEILDG